MFDKKPLPVPDLVNADYAQIEERMMADMAKTFGVPEKHLGSPTGRRPSEPEMQKLPIPKD